MKRTKAGFGTPGIRVHLPLEEDILGGEPGCRWDRAQGLRSPPLFSEKLEGPVPLCIL